MTTEQLLAQQDRRKALWRAKCRCAGPLSHCQCITRCETCGHVRADHDYDGAPDTRRHWGSCEVPDCQCRRFDDEDE